MRSIGLAVEKLTAGSLEWLIRPNDRGLVAPCEA